MLTKSTWDTQAGRVRLPGGSFGAEVRGKSGGAGGAEERGDTAAACSDMPNPRGCPNCFCFLITVEAIPSGGDLWPVGLLQAEFLEPGAFRNDHLLPAAPGCC